MSGDVVLQALNQACSQEPSVLKQAEHVLKTLETHSGFYTSLMSVICNYSLERNVRLLAVLYLKNGVNKYWRKTAPNAISEEEKEYLRSQLISNFNEPVAQIATQIAVLIGKIARVDCPSQWGSLVPTLISAIQCDDMAIRQHAMLVFYHVVKVLASKRIANDRQIFQELTNNIFELLVSMWTRYTDTFFHQLDVGDSAPSLIALADSALIVFKMLRQMFVFGHGNELQELLNNTCSVRNGCLTSTVYRMEQYAAAKSRCAELGGEDLLLRRSKAMVTFSKLLLELVEWHPAAFVPFIPSALQLIVNYNFTPEGRNSGFERFSVNTLNLMRSILRCDIYRPAKVIENTPHTCTLEAHRLKQEFFSPNTLEQLVHCLLLEYFPLTQEDLSNWDDDPEEFMCEEGGDSWKFSLRPCIENLYLTLFKEFRSVLGPCVLSIVKAHPCPAGEEDLAAMLRADAMLNAVGLASFELYDDVDFDSWFMSELLPQLNKQHSNSRVLRRRVIWVCGCWVGVKLSPHLRPSLYEASIHLLQEGEDLVVRLEAATVIQRAIDDFEFDRTTFLPYLETIFTRLFCLLKQVRECETKMSVLHVMSFVVERVGSAIRPHAAGLLAYLPDLWRESEHHDMLRCAILSTLLQLVIGLGPEARQLYPLLLPVLTLATDINQPAHVYLLEDGLELWEATLHMASEPCAELGALFNNLPHLFDYNTEYLKMCLHISEEWLLLGGVASLAAHGAPLAAAIASLLPDLRSEGVTEVMKLVETLIQAYPDVAPVILSPVLPHALQQLITNNAMYPQEFASYVCVVGRLALHNTQWFMAWLSSMAQQSGREPQQLLSSLLSVWLDGMDHVVGMGRKKMLCLALLALVQTGDAACVARAHHVLGACVECLHDVCRDDGGPSTDCLLDVWSCEGRQDDATQHEARVRELSRRDPVHSVALVTAVHHATHHLAATALDDMHPELRAQLQDFLTHM